MWTVRFRESSDRAGALSHSSNDTAEGADVDSAELVQEECCWDSQESDSDVGVAIAVIAHVSPSGSKVHSLIGALRIQTHARMVAAPPIHAQSLPIMLQIMPMLIASYCA